jgi:hypothetical protein
MNQEYGMTVASRMQAAEDFNKARTLAFLSKIQHFLSPDKDRLLNFNDVKDILKPRNEVYQGIQVVPIKLIVGSEGRYQDFNKYFLPKSDYLRNRWERVDEALIESVILPPIRLYEIGGVYFVRDGNHRVSVAKAQGVESIDAEVTSLSSEVTITPSMTSDDLRKAVIKMEKTVFYEKTDFEGLTGCKTLDFSMPGRYDVIYNHILVHKYYLNEHFDGELPFFDALVSWYNNVYEPIIQIIEEEGLCAEFPKRTPSDLYVFIVKRWDFLKEKYGVTYSATDAARDFRRRFGEKPKNIFQAIIGAAESPLPDPTEEELEE